MGYCTISSADAEVLFPAGLNLSKNPDDDGYSPVFLPPTDFLA